MSLPSIDSKNEASNGNSLKQVASLSNFSTLKTKTILFLKKSVEFQQNTRCYNAGDKILPLLPVGFDLMLLKPQTSVKTIQCSVFL
jgi:hypothetical protein